MIAGIITSLTDWLFAGDWLKTFYNRYPDVWRFVGCTGEGTAIALSSPMPFVTSAMFAGLRPPWPAFVGHGGEAWRQAHLRQAGRKRVWSAGRVAP